MKVSDVMSKRVVTVSPETLFRDVWEKIFRRRVNALPVVDKKKKLLGIITREDLLSRLYPKYQEVMEQLETNADFEGLETRVEDLVTLRAKDLMCKKVIFTRDETLIMRALSRMIVRRVNQLPVLTEDDRVVGMITKGDIFYTLFRKHLAHRKPGPRRLSHRGKK